jgi:hypothetical protein
MANAVGILSTIIIIVIRSLVFLLFVNMYGYMVFTYFYKKGRIISSPSWFLVQPLPIAHYLALPIP